MAPNKTNKTGNVSELQVEDRKKMNKVRLVFKYLKIKIKLKKTLSKIWFNKQCMHKNITPKYAEIKIKTAEK